MVLEFLFKTETERSWETKKGIFESSPLSLQSWARAAQNRSPVSVFESQSTQHSQLLFEHSCSVGLCFLFFLGALCLCSFVMAHFSLACSRDRENRLSEKWDNCSTESAGWRPAGLQPGPGLGELESGNVSEVSWSSQEPETYHQILVCMCLLNYGFERRSPLVWPSIEKPIICTTPPFPPISYEIFFIL